MSLLTPERIGEAAPQVQTFLRKVALVDTEHWIQGNLPRVNSLPGADVLAKQVVDLREALRRYLAGQEARFIAYVREHPPEMRPVDAGALTALPPEAVLTYHVWLQGIIRATEERDKEELARLVRAHLQECIGTGAMAARRQMGAQAPGFGRLTQKEALALLRRMPADSIDPSEQAFRRAVADRAHRRDLQGSVMRDGGGRPVAAATYSTRGKTLAVRYLGSLERAVPGAGLHLLRELAGLAASRQQGLTITAPAEGSRALRALGFIEQMGGRFTISANSALALAQSAPGPSPAWTRAGLLEGPAATFDTRPEAELGWALEQAQAWEPVRKAIAPLGADAPGQAMATLMGDDGTLLALARYYLPERAGDLIVRHLWLRPGAPPATGRQIMRKLAGLAAQAGRGLRFTDAASASVGLATRLGMVEVAEGYGFTAQQAAAFASGLTRGMTFAGSIAWELAVAGAAEYLENIIIPGVIDTVSATTHRKLVDALIEGLAAGEGTNDLITRIRALDETAFGLVRAERIARTEAITANRAGGYQMAVASGSAEKRWVSRLMPNTRDWHREAHGQQVPIAKPFEVNNRKGVPEELLFPGDRSLGAGPDNVIQCVCAPLYLSPGVSDDTTFARYGASRSAGGPGPVIALVPEPVRKADVISLDDLREFVAKDKGWMPGPNAHWKRRDSGSTAVAERPASTAYRIIHQPRKESGARADDLSLVRADVYEHPEWYGGDEYPEMVPIVEAMRGNPDMRLTVYRAVPIEGTGPNYGDWVTPVRHYAELHGEILAGMGEAAEGETFKILEKEVAVRDLVWPGDYLPEFGWFPERVQKDKGWMPGPNAGWKRLDEAPAKLTTANVDAKLAEVRAKWSKEDEALLERQRQAGPPPYDPLVREGWWKEVEPEPDGTLYPMAVSDAARGGYADAQRFADPGQHKRVWMAPGEYLRVVDEMFSKQYGQRVSSDRILRDLEGLDELRQRIRDGEALAIPWLDYNAGDAMLNGQEGRHRALAAMLEGVESMPVDIVLRHGEQWEYHPEAMDDLRTTYGIVLQDEPKQQLRKRWVGERVLAILKPRALLRPASNDVSPGGQPGANRDGGDDGPA